MRWRRARRPQDKSDPRGLAFGRSLLLRRQGALRRQYAWLLPPWVIVCHRGRRSGRMHRTPVNAYKHDNTLAVVVLYGEESD
jgi:predicted deacetylase